MRPRDLYPIVEALGAEGHGLKASCRLLGVSSAGFFHWRGRPLSARAVRRAWLTDAVIEIWHRSRRCYGWRRIQAELAHCWGHHASRKLLRSIMREHGICGLPRQKSRHRREARSTPPAASPQGEPPRVSHRLRGLRVALAVAAAVEPMPPGRHGHGPNRPTAMRLGDRRLRAEPDWPVAETAQRP